ncbi:hypothetical protein PR048_001358 [Dryococelus australis]|uniref:Uncharacterized protein n=1 Tax=Dryococelus australis TaxID=614101 RepID=A0ABQ9IHU1_9NEOP|nr:hypothetical protein PR048_001358 [Dryococelus australis]
MSQGASAALGNLRGGAPGSISGPGAGAARSSRLRYISTAALAGQPRLAMGCTAARGCHRGVEIVDLEDALRAVAGCSDYTPPTQLNRVLFPTGSHPDFCMRESCRAMPLPGGFLPSPLPLHYGAAPYSPRFTLLGSQDLDVNSRSALRVEAMGELMHTCRSPLAPPQTGARVPPYTKANRVRFPAGTLLNLHLWESCWTMLLVCVFFSGIS